MPSFYNPPSSGSGSPQLPAWTWADGDSGTISAGQFVTNNDPDIDGTTAILLSSSVVGVAQWASLANPSFIIFTNSAGVSSRFLIGSISENATSIQFGVTYKASNGGTWSGLYTVSFTPANIGLNLTGILKSDGTTAAAAAAGTDYIAPGGSGDISGTSGVNSSITTAITSGANDAISTFSGNGMSFGVLQGSAGITPAADGTYSPVTSITIKNGVVTAIS